MSTRYLIIGGGVAGTTAAETIRRRDPDGEVFLVGEEPHRLYSRVMLSKPGFFLEKIPFDRVWLKAPSWYADNRVTFMSGRKAVRLEPKENVVVLDDGARLAFDKLLIATGTCSRRWGVQGALKAGVHYLRTIDDAQGIIAAVRTAKRAVVIGSGFVAFETCELLRQAGLEVTAVIRERYFWEPMLDEASGRIVERALEREGVKIVRGAEVAEVAGGASVEGVMLKDGSIVPCDLIIAGIGVLCVTDWAQQGGVSVGRGVRANEYLETDRPGVWAAGDVAEYMDVIIGEHVMAATWLSAQMQGKAAAENMTGERKPYRMVSFMSAQAFGMNIAFIGDIVPKPGHDSLFRGEPQKGEFSRLVIKGKELVGATVIGRMEEVGLITRLIEGDVDVSEKKEALADTGTDLKTLLTT